MFHVSTRAVSGTSRNVTWATRTKTTKKRDAMGLGMQQFWRHSSSGSHSSRSVSFIIPFQLSPAVVVNNLVGNWCTLIFSQYLVRAPNSTFSYWKLLPSSIKTKESIIYNTLLINTCLSMVSQSANGTLFRQKSSWALTLLLATCGYPEESEKGHAEWSEVCVLAQALTRMVLVTLCS